MTLRKKKINKCIGCYTCWTKSPGVCVHKDDMTAELFPKWVEADLAVYATPLYYFTLNAVMKAFMERTLPVLEPFLHRVEGKSFHPMRYGLIRRELSFLRCRVSRSVSIRSALPIC